LSLYVVVVLVYYTPLCVELVVQLCCFSIFLVE